MMNAGIVIKETTMTYIIRYNIFFARVIQSEFVVKNFADDFDILS